MQTSDNMNSRRCDSLRLLATIIQIQILLSLELAKISAVSRKLVQPSCGLLLNTKDSILQLSASNDNTKTQNTLS